MTDRTSMPIMGCAAITSIPWAAIEEHERQAMANHGQTLKRLAGRGGLGVCEAVAIIEDRRWHRMDKAVAEQRLMGLCKPKVSARVMKIYVAGPMTGLPGLNFPAFHAATAHLRALGHTVVNPAEVNPDTTAAWEVCMRRDIAELVTCDGIHLLPGWEASRGATLEHHIATQLKLHIMHHPA